MENSRKGFIEILIFLNAYFLTRVSKKFCKIVQKNSSHRNELTFFPLTSS